jgi:hypothetical protein
VDSLTINFDCGFIMWECIKDKGPMDEICLDDLNTVFENERRDVDSKVEFYESTGSPFNFSDLHGSVNHTSPFADTPKKSRNKPSYWMLDKLSVVCDEEGWSYSDSVETWLREYKSTLICDVSHRHLHKSTHQLVAAPYEGCMFRRRVWRRLDLNSRTDSVVMKYSPKTSRIFEEDFPELSCTTDTDYSDDITLDAYLFYDEDENGFPQPAAVGRGHGRLRSGLKVIVDAKTFTPENSPANGGPSIAKQTNNIVPAVHCNDDTLDSFFPRAGKTLPTTASSDDAEKVVLQAEMLPDRTNKFDEEPELPIARYPLDPVRPAEKFDAPVLLAAAILLVGIGLFQFWGRTIT